MLRKLKQNLNLNMLNYIKHQNLQHIIHKLYQQNRNQHFNMMDYMQKLNLKRKLYNQFQINNKNLHIKQELELQHMKPIHYYIKYKLLQLPNNIQKHMLNLKLDFYMKEFLQHKQHKFFQLKQIQLKYKLNHMLLLNLHKLNNLIHQ